MGSISYQVYRVYLHHTSQNSALKTSTQYEDHFRNGIFIDYVVVAHILLWSLWCRQSGDHPENNLAKFGYILDMNYFLKTESLCVLGYLLKLTPKNMAI
jgi:hypothetical protein